MYHITYDFVNENIYFRTENDQYPFKLINKYTIILIKIGIE